MRTLFVLLIIGAITHAAPPNVVIVFVDDFGWGDPSCYGNPLVKTPRMDRMAAEGVRFTQGYVASPICSPSRCGLITGQYPGQWKITSYLQTKAGNAACDMADYLDPKAPSLPRMMKDAGYATAHIGKWHLGGGRDVTDAPKFAAYGYDLGIGTYESPEPHPDLTSTKWIWAESDKVKRHERSQWMVDRTLEFIAKAKGKPAFVNLWLDDTHTPFVPSPAQLAKVEKPGDKPQVAKYKAVLAETDVQIGRLLDGLAGTDTLVFVIGDNGAMPTLEQNRVAGLRGSKMSLYEGGTRVPFIAWRPKTMKPAVNETTVISTLDLFPTLAKLGGATLPKEYAGAGEDLTAALANETPKRSKPIFWEYGRNEKSFGYPREKENRSPNVAVRDGDWKLLVNADGKGEELYNLASDAKETKNVAAENKEVAERLKTAALAWRKTLP